MTRPITTFQLYRMPEFLAFCKAAGIEVNLPVPMDGKGVGVIIDIPADLYGIVTVTQRYHLRPGYADEMKKKTAVVETTTVHTESVKTHMLSDTNP